MRRGDRPRAGSRHRLSHQASPEPVGRVQARRVLRRRQRSALARDAAQHGVGEARAKLSRPLARATVSATAACGGVLEEQELGGAEAEQVAHPDRPRRLAQEARRARRRSGRAGAAWSPPAGGHRRDRARRAGRARDGRRSASSSGRCSPSTRSSTSSASRRALPGSAMGRLRPRADRSAGRPGPAGSTPRSPPGHRTRRRCRSGGLRSARGGSRRAP